MTLNRSQGEVLRVEDMSVISIIFLKCRIHSCQTQ